MTKIVTNFIPQRSFNFHLKVTILKKERLAWQICWSSGLYLRFFFENPYLAMAEWIMSLLFYFFFFGGVKRDYRHKMGQCQKQSPEVFCKKGVLRNFAKFTAKHLCQSLFFNKVAGLAHVFSCEFCEIFKETFFHRTSLVAASANRKRRKEQV